MAKTGGWCRKLTDKKKANATNNKLGRQIPLSRRIDKALTYSAKHIALLEHRERIARGHNLQAVDCFPGDGLPDDSLASLKPPKTNWERAQDDKRAPLKREMRAGWLKPRTPTIDPVKQALALLGR